MIPPPPTSTLFPTRRSSDLALSSHVGVGSQNIELRVERRFGPRSEEHTSELQSRGHLVCRLLLEKKKMKSAARVSVSFDKELPTCSAIARFSLRGICSTSAS